MCVASDPQALKYIFGTLKLFSSFLPHALSYLIYAMFNIHFSVPANFVLFAYLDVFLELNFVSITTVISFNFCTTLLRLFKRHILKAFWRSRHWHLDISIDTAQFHFSLTN